MKTRKALIHQSYEDGILFYIVVKQKFVDEKWVDVGSLHFKFRRNARIYADLYDSCTKYLDE